MSTIPNNAIPHAYAEPEANAEQSNGSSFLLDNAKRLADVARENPKTVLAVGAGVVAATAATVALTRGRSGASSGGSKGRKSKS